MNAERLLKLADHLDKVPSETFDINDWACGTTACAVGHACMMEEFKKEGLKLVDGKYDWPTPQYDGARGFEAAKTFFDVGVDVYYLFSNDYYLSGDKTTAKDVAGRIRQYVKMGGRDE